MTEFNLYKQIVLNLIIKAHGPLLHGDPLRVLLGYSSGGAMRSAVSRDLVEVTLMELPHRKGKFALSEDLSIWLVDQREKHNPVIPVDFSSMNSLFTDLDSGLKTYDILLHEEALVSLLKVRDREELLRLYRNNQLPFAVFRLDNRRHNLFALLPEVIPYLMSLKSSI